MRARDGRAELEVVDDGVGFDVEAVRGRGGMGLSSMRERLERVGGSLAVAALLGRAPGVQAVMPILVRPWIVCGIVESYQGPPGRSSGGGNGASLLNGAGEAQQWHGRNRDDRDGEDDGTVRLSSHLGGR